MHSLTIGDIQLAVQGIENEVWQTRAELQQIKGLLIRIESHLARGPVKNHKKPPKPPRKHSR